MYIHHPGSVFKLATPTTAHSALPTQMSHSNCVPTRFLRSLFSIIHLHNSTTPCRTPTSRVYIHQPSSVVCIRPGTGAHVVPLEQRERLQAARLLGRSAPAYGAAVSRLHSECGGGERETCHTREFVMVPPQCVTPQLFLYLPRPTLLIVCHTPIRHTHRLRKKKKQRKECEFKSPSLRC